MESRPEIVAFDLDAKTITFRYQTEGDVQRHIVGEPEAQRWAVLVNDDGEPYAVDNGSVRRGVDVSGNVEPRRGRPDAPPERTTVQLWKIQQAALRFAAWYDEGRDLPATRDCRDEVRRLCADLEANRSDKAPPVEERDVNDDHMAAEIERMERTAASGRPATRDCRDEVRRLCADLEAMRSDKAPTNYLTGNRDIPASFITAIQAVIREAQYHGSSNTWSLPVPVLSALAIETKGLQPSSPETAPTVIAMAEAIRESHRTGEAGGGK